jgi:cytosine/adenosine deaminase-related metal-dependent hydrolase
VTDAMPPGLVNAHTHVYSGLAPLGMPRPAEPPANFLQILERIWWRLDRALDEGTLRASARLYAAESLLHGTPVLIDHHESPNFIEGSLDVIADACEELGVRALLCYGATERNGGRDEARRGLAECRRFILSNRRRLVRGAIGLHASFTVSDETVREAGALCRDLGAVLHVHVAEDAADMEDALARGYQSPVHRLEALGALVPGSILAHGVHLDEAQVRRAADAGGWFVQNPRSNRGNGVGYPVALVASARVALGTDGYPADMREEWRTAAALGAGLAQAPDVPGARLRNGLRLAREVLDLAEDGQAAPGAPEATAAGAEEWAEQARARCLTRLVVDGRTVIEDGRLLTARLDNIREDARREAARLWTRMNEVAP